MVKRYFDNHAVGYNSAYQKKDNTRSFIFSERKKLVLEMLDIGEGRVLDAGCGPGVYTDRLSEAGYEIYGVDASEGMIALARAKHFKNAKFFVGSVDDLKFQDTFFDAILCIGVLEYLKDVEKAIKEAARVIRPGGIAIFTVPNAQSFLNTSNLLARNIVKSVCKLLKIKPPGSLLDYNYELRLFSGKDLDLLLERNGFKIEKARFHIFRLPFLNKIFPEASLYLMKKMNFVSSPFLGINYVVKCRRI